MKGIAAAILTFEAIIALLGGLYVASTEDVSGPLLWSLVGVVVALQVARRVGDYAISRPAREMLFTAVDREVRFKAKPVIDIVIYRGGDMLAAWGVTALTGLGFSLAAVALVGAARLIWLLLPISTGL